VKKLVGLSNVLETATRWVSNILLAVMLVFVFVEVVNRYFFGISHSILATVAQWSLVWVAYLMVGVVEKSRLHVKIDLLPRRLPERCQVIFLLVADTAVTTLCIFLVWSGISLAQMTRQTGLLSITEVPIPMWIVGLCVPLGAILLGFFSVEHLIADIGSLSTHPKKRE